MKGFIDENGYDRPPCGTCKYRDRMTVLSPCYGCISNLDLALHKPNNETDFLSYEKEEKNGTDNDSNM